MDLRPSNRKRSAFTFTELLLTMAIGTLMLALVGSVCLQLSRTSTSLYAFSSLSARDRIAMERLGNDLRNAEAFANLNKTNISLLINGDVIRFAFHTNEHRLYRFTATNSEVLLPNCHALEFSFHSKKPNTFDQHTASTSACKVIKVTWTSALSPGRSTSPSTVHSLQFLNRQP